MLLSLMIFFSPQSPLAVQASFTKSWGPLQANKRKSAMASWPAMTSGGSSTKAVMENQPRDSLGDYMHVSCEFPNKGRGNTNHCW